MALGLDPNTGKIDAPTSPGGIINPAWKQADNAFITWMDTVNEATGYALHEGVDKIFETNDSAAPVVEQGKPAPGLAEQTIAGFPIKTLALVGLGVLGIGFVLSRI